MDHTHKNSGKKLQAEKPKKEKHSNTPQKKNLNKLLKKNRGEKSVKPTGEGALLWYTRYLQDLNDFLNNIYTF